MTCRVIKVNDLNRLEEKDSFCEDIFVLLDGEMSKKEEIEVFLRELSIHYKIYPLVHTKDSIAKQIQHKIQSSQKYVFISFDETSHIHDEDCVLSCLSLHHTPILLDIKEYPDKEQLVSFIHLGLVCGLVVEKIEDIKNNEEYLKNGLISFVLFSLDCMCIEEARKLITKEYSKYICDILLEDSVFAIKENKEVYSISNAVDVLTIFTHDERKMRQ